VLVCWCAAVLLLLLLPLGRRTSPGGRLPSVRSMRARCSTSSCVLKVGVGVGVRGRGRCSTSSCVLKVGVGVGVRRPNPRVGVRRPNPR
jgi:hypothetical protein